MGGVVIVRAASVQFYFDADIIGIAKVICGLRTDCTYPEDPGDTINKRKRPPCGIPKSAPDTTWLPTVTERGWIIISRDHRIRDNPLERRAVREHGARMVALSGADAGTKWGQLELLMMRWRRIEKLLDEDGPFIYLASRSSFEPLDLSDRPGPARSRSVPSRSRVPRPPRRHRGPDDTLFDPS